MKLMLVVSRGPSREYYTDVIHVDAYELGAFWTYAHGRRLIKTHINRFLGTPQTPVGWYAKLPGAAGVRRHGVYENELYIHDEEG